MDKSKLIKKYNILELVEYLYKLDEPKNRIMLGDSVDIIIKTRVRIDELVYIENRGFVRCLFLQDLIMIICSQQYFDIIIKRLDNDKDRKEFAKKAKIIDNYIVFDSCTMIFKGDNQKWKKQRK